MISREELNEKNSRAPPSLVDREALAQAVFAKMDGGSRYNRHDVQHFIRSTLTSTVRALHRWKMSDELLFGDPVENPAASLDNPQRYGYFVRRGYREGRLNPGPYIELTDARGKFWTCKGDLIVKIGRKDCPALPFTSSHPPENIEPGA